MMHAKPQTESPSDITSSRADGADAERSYFRVVIVLFAAYLILATGLFYFRGFRSPTPDRWAPFLFLAALALGRGRAFVRDWIPFVALLFGYQYMRGVAGQVADVGSLTATDHGQVQLDFLLDAERWLFGGAIPSIWLQQRLFREGDAQWYDVVSGLVYLLHFVFPLVFAFGLWIRNKDHYWRFIIALAAMSYVSFLFFLLLPTAPPWLAQEWGVIQGLERPSGQAYRALLAHRADNFDTFQLWTKASPNPVAAFPSLHAAYPWLVMLFARRFFGRLGWSFILYNIAVWFCIVYFGLHWAVDIIAGIALATAVFVIMERLWPRLVGFQGVTWPAPLTVTVAGTQSIVASGAAAVHRRIITHPLARDLVGVFVVATIASTTFLYILQRGGMVGINSALQFYPGYDFLGDQLASGHLPAWMPHWYGGMPFIADPQSGWMYLPAMVIFTLFPLKWAIQLFLAAHVLLVGLGAYTLGRVLGLGVVAAVVAAAAFQLNGWMTVRLTCCPAEFEVMGWLPIALLGVELSVRNHSWLGRATGWGITSVAMSQILAAWLGQGGHYASLAVGGYIVYRTLLDPPALMTVHRRVTALVVHSVAIGGLSLAFAAAALFPRLEFLAISSLADGYPWVGVRGGMPSLDQLTQRIMGRTSYYAGVATLALAGIGVLLGRRRHAAPFFALLALVAALLSLRALTPLHYLLHVTMPRFEDVSRNLPERSLMVFFLAVAMLAGIAVESLAARSARGIRWVVALAPVGLLALLTVARAAGNPYIGPWTLLPILAIGVIVLGASLPWLPGIRRAAPLLLLGVLLVDLLTSGHVMIHESPQRLGIMRADLTTYDDPPPAATYLLSPAQSEPFRFIGYDAGRRELEGTVLYRRQFHDPATVALLVNNRGAFHGLDDLQGTVNPIQVDRFTDLITAANGFSQEYHDANIYPSGLDSPILDLLNVRYVVVPAAVPAGRPDLLHLSQRLPTVFTDADVRVLENTRALPRAWIVHNAVQASQTEALAMLANGDVDPRRTAVVETPVPPLGNPAPSDNAMIVRHEPARIEVRTHTGEAGLLVLSEIAYPAWSAYVDGEQVALLTANGGLRAVPVPAGDHSVELRYESTTLRAGLAISATAYAAFPLLGLLAWRARRTAGRGTSGRLAGI